MLNEIHVEAIKEELANFQQENLELKAHCNNLIKTLNEIVNLECCMMDQGAYMASVAIKKTPRQSLAEHNADEIRKLIYNSRPPVDFSLSRTEIIEKLRERADNLEAGK